MTPFESVMIFGHPIQIAWLGLGVLFVLAVLEGIYLRLRGRGFDARDALTDVAMYAGNFAILIVWAPLIFVLYDVLHDHALFDLGRQSPLAANAPWLPWALLFVSEDLAYYCFHRASHRVRLLWVSHENHHSSTSFTWFVALRQTWTPFLAVVFWLPLPLLGFDPLMILAAQSASLVCQSFLHTELVGALGPLGIIFNTPGHHRAHHGADEACVDNNFGGVLIVWDRMFGTFYGGAPIAYGIGDEHASYNPIKVGFNAWAGLARDVVRSPSHALSYLFRAPGWTPSAPSKGSPS